jgi:hypothetical protein
MLLGISWGMHLETLWEQGEKTKKIPFPFQKEKN